MNAQAQIDQLKNDIGLILARYHVPLDDRSYVLEQIEAAVASIIDEQQAAFQNAISGVRREIETERTNVRSEVNRIKDIASSNMDSLKAKLEEAYHEGFSDGAESGQELANKRPSLWKVILAVSLGIAALIFAVKSFGRG